MTKNIDEKIQDAKKKLKQAEEKQASGAEFMPDYIDLQGVRFFKPKVAHIWLFDRMKHAVAGWASLKDFGVCITYALAHTQKDIRNKLMREFTQNQIVDLAYGFVCEHELTNETIDEVLQKLAFKVLNISDDKEESDSKKEAADQEPSLSGGQE